MSREDARAALTLAVLAALGLGARWLLAPAPSAAPGDVQLAVGHRADSSDLERLADRAARLSRPLAPGERIDLNRADAAELARLPRIGPTLAGRIVADRASQGPFRRFEELDRVVGVGPKLLEAIRPHAALSGVPVPPASIDSP